ncbi:MAG: KTSC domain-containing protein [Proteobacteria bacterium]|nr:KTSC domain-containing protein [Pseudomonadota bacterium]
MKMENVESSNIARIGHDAGSSTLQIEFKNGGTYQYFDVHRDVYDSMMVAGVSKGKFLHANIKGTYRFSKV